MFYRLLLAVLCCVLAGCAQRRVVAISPGAIRSNESAAIEVARKFVQAQLDYAREDRDRDGVREYAQRFVATHRHPDGLQPKSRQPRAQLWEAIAATRGNGPAWHGYRFAILTRQTPPARGGARDYLVGTYLTGGFALLAWPAQYGVTGRRTFLVNQTGRVLQKDLGPGTAQFASRLTSYSPDATWTPVAR